MLRRIRQRGSLTLAEPVEQPSSSLDESGLLEKDDTIAIVFNIDIVHGEEKKTLVGIDGWVAKLIVIE